MFSPTRDFLAPARQVGVGQNMSFCMWIDERLGFAVVENDEHHAQTGRARDDSVNKGDV